ncbi:MAG: bifunctional oligoribonuclease/PAP phosphatase NrnA [Actinomycetota bacterium]|nr:bifunctional oligoribonuclease/PAP phosphatase NrnA [Actinomycetota bacterium]
MVNSREAIRKAAEVLGEAEAVAVTCHVGPDGDALGSALGFALAARKAGKQAWVSFGEPFAISDKYRFLPLDSLVPPGDLPADAPVLVAFDTGSLDRLGGLSEAAKAAGCLIVVDHHVSNQGFGDIDIIDPQAAASAQLAFYLIQELGWPLDAEVATCLLVGVVTDTGRFQYSNARPEVFRVAAALVEAGARPELIGQNVYEKMPFGYLKVAAAVLGRSVLEPDRAFVWSVLLASDLEAADIAVEDSEPLIDALRVAREAEVAALAKEVGDGQVRVSLRSRGLVDVEMIATHLGGGGHHNAAGFTFEGSAAQAIDEVRTRLPGE